MVPLIFIMMRDYGGCGNTNRLYAGFVEDRVFLYHLVLCPGVLGGAPKTAQSLLVPPQQPLLTIQPPPVMGRT